MMEIHREASATEVTIRCLLRVHQEKITFRGSLTPGVLTEEAPISGIDPPPSSVSITAAAPRSGFDRRALDVFWAR
jgi:hypothetical protein